MAKRQSLFRRFLKAFLSPFDSTPEVGVELPRAKRAPARERVVDSRTKIPDDAKIEIMRTWTDRNGYKNKPWGGWKDDDIVDETQVIVHVTSPSNGLDYYRTIVGPFGNQAVDNVIDLIQAEFWNSSP